MTMSHINKGWRRNGSTGSLGGLSTSAGGGLSTGPGGGASTGPGGGMSTGPGRGLSTGPGGGLSTGPGGGLSTGAGGGLSSGPTPYYSNIPPREVYLKHLKEYCYEDAYQILKSAWNVEVDLSLCP